MGPLRGLSEREVLDLQLYSLPILLSNVVAI